MSMGIGNLKAMPTAGGAGAYPIQELNALKNMSSDQIKAIAMDPNNPIRTFAIARLNSMKINGTLQNTQGAGQQPTVAQKVLQEANTQPGIGAIPQDMPPQGPPQGIQMAQNAPPQGAPVSMAEGGLTELPIDDSMYNEQNFAGGGIVAFTPGGSVENKDWKYWMQHLSGGDVDENGNVINPKVASYDKEKRYNRFASINKEPMPEAPKVKTDYADIMGSELSAHPDYNKSLGNTPLDPSAFLSQMPNIDMMPKKDDTFTPPKEAGSNFNLAAPGNIAKPADVVIPDEMTIEKAVARNKKLNEDMGVDTEYFAKRQKESKKSGEEELADTKKFGEANIYMSLAQGVLNTRDKGGIAGGIAKNLTPALGQYNKDLKEVNRHNKDTADHLADAEYANKLGQVDKADRYMQKADDSREKAQSLKAQIDHNDYQSQLTRDTSITNANNQIKASMAMKKMDLSPEREGAYNQYMNYAKQSPEYYAKDSTGNNVFNFKKATEDAVMHSSKKSDWELYNEQIVRPSIASGTEPMPYATWIKLKGSATDSDAGWGAMTVGNKTK